MSNPTNRSTPQPTNAIKNIEVGKFYLIHDGSKTGHPGLVIWKDDNQNLYLIIKFGTSSNKDNASFPYPIGPDIKQSFYFKRPFLGKRKDIGNKPFADLVVNSVDISNILNGMDITNPMCSSNVTGRNLHSYLYFIKKSPPIGL